MKKNVTRFFTVLILIINLLFNQNNQSQKKIGLVLSGGGIKGFGHLGTLELIDSLNIPIDYVVGSSIGAISAALYASGCSASEIKKIAYKTNWDEIFSQNRKRNKLHFFQKQDVNKYQLSFALKGFKPTVPISLTSGQYAYEYLLDLFKGYETIEDYNQLVVPFRCNATDIISGEEIVFDSGSIAQSLRASTSIPTVFSPLEYNNNLLVDGGLINNIPIDIAENIGAEYVIAVDVSKTEKNKNKLNSVFNIIQEIINLYGYQNKVDNLKNGDIIVSPDLNNYSLMSLDKQSLDAIAKEGKKAAYKQLKKFVELKKETEFIKLDALTTNSITIRKVILDKDLENDSLANNFFKDNSKIYKNDFLNKITMIRDNEKFFNLHYLFKKTKDKNIYDLYLNANTNKSIIINDIIVNGNKKISDDFILSLFSIEMGDKLNIKKLNNEIEDAYKTDYFHYINYQLNQNNLNQYDLVFNVKENPTKQIKMGVIWDNHYKLIGKLKLDLINKPLKNIRIQDELLFSGIKRNSLSFNYLITNNNKISLIPFIKLTNMLKDLQLSNRTLNYKLKGVALGLVFPITKFGSIEFSYNQDINYYKQKGELNYSRDINYLKILLDFDQLDHLLFPKEGSKLILNYHSSEKSIVKNKLTKQDSHLSKYNYINTNFEFYKTVNYKHTLRFFHLYKNSNHMIPLHLQTSYINYDWAIGYNEYDLFSKDINSGGIEYQYHYKNSTTFRLIINKLFKINEQKNGPLTYGVGIRIRSIVGPLNFVWGRGYSEPLNQKSKKQNILYFNFGVKL